LRAEETNAYRKFQNDWISGSTRTFVEIAPILL
jgi:hypothetical protein